MISYIPYPLLLFYSIVAAGVLSICTVLALARKRITNILYYDITIQPHSANIISKMQLLAMAFLETPFVLSIVLVILSFNLASSLNVYIAFLPSVYAIIIFTSAVITIYYSGYHIGHIVNLASIHPQYESKLMMQLFLFLSTIQAPFIILFVILLYNKYSLLGDVSNIFFDNYFLVFIISLGLMLLIMQYSLCMTIDKLIWYIQAFYQKYPGQIGALVFLLIMHMGFFQAPYIFSFIVFIILSKFFVVPISGLYSTFSFLALLFSIIGSRVIIQSGKIVHTAIAKFTPILETNKKIMQFALLSQIILDSRILYILLIILFAFNFF